MPGTIYKSDLKNKLDEAVSSYLKSAADQPVHWQEWSDEVFTLAEKLDRPILLDIGAVWCHWCHVMDRESYEDEETARLINENFIPVKIDRDERPDVDRRYQTFVQATGGGGGWPLTCFLTKEGKLFFGGTYFPPVDTNGRPGFKNLLRRISEMYRTKRQDVIEHSRDIFERITEHEESKNRKGELSVSHVEQIMQSIEQNFDPVYGGIGTAPKFPGSSSMSLAMLSYSMSGNSRHLGIAEITLENMAAGGIYDHVGGGFHRYSVDQYWHVPHFEKMTSDNAELLRNYLELYRITGNTKYRKTAEGIIDWYERDMTDKQTGGFFAHQDADITLEDDGDYFTWRKDELESALSGDEKELFFRYYGISETPRDLHGTTDRNVLYTAGKPENAAEEFNISPEDADRLIGSALKKLLNVRYSRKAPFIDRTIYASYNGMMLSSYAFAYRILDDNKLKAFFVKTLDLIIDKMYDRSKGFAHSYAGGKAGIYGLLSDQVWMASALLDGFEMTGDPKYFQLAKSVSDNILDKFEDKDKGGFFDRAVEDQESGIFSLKQKPFEDIPSSSSNAVAVRLLNRLYYLTGVKECRTAAEKTLKSFAGNIANNGTYIGAYGISLYLHLNPPPQVVITGRRSDPGLNLMINAAKEIYIPYMEIYTIDPGDEDIDRLPYSLKEKILSARVSEKSSAFVCSGNTCSAPVHDPRGLNGILSSIENRK
ncbi:thioredoxin domain-containing protein [candidate division KSB1 bacterium]